MSADVVFSVPDVALNTAHIDFREGNAELHSQEPGAEVRAMTLVAAGDAGHFRTIEIHIFEPTITSKWRFAQIAPGDPSGTSFVTN